MRSLRRTRRPLLALVVLVVALAVAYGVQASRSHGPTPSPSASGGTSAAGSPSGTNAAASPSGLAQQRVALSSLPVQARRTVQLIAAGGPFPYPDDDGVVFHNYEHDLPAESDAYYHEYTVPTPGSPDRGARRIVTGRGGQVYYTADHYESFVAVDVTR